LNRRAWIIRRERRSELVRRLSVHEFIELARLRGDALDADHSREAPGIFVIREQLDRLDSNGIRWFAAGDNALSQCKPLKNSEYCMTIA
jgi:hypothetical protein